MMHAFIIWESGFSYAGRLLREISLTFDVKRAESITWTSDALHDRLTGLYPNRIFHPEHPKVKEIGGTKLIVIFAMDPKPTLVNALNKRVREYKNRYRAEFGVNFLHGSENEEEALYNFRALGMGTDDEFAQLKVLPRRIVFLERGESTRITTILKPTFERVEDVFCVLNEHENYAVLRNWENLPDEIHLDGHTDVDLLVQDYDRTSTLLGAERVFLDERRVHQHITIGDQKVPFDLRFVGDGYYDPSWQQTMLGRRVLARGFYHLALEDYFWSLLYHAVYHKKELRQDYQERLRELCAELPEANVDAISNVSSARRLLSIFLKNQRYRVTRPTDTSVNVFQTRLGQGLHFIVGNLRFVFSLFARKRYEDLSEVKGLAKELGDVRHAKVLKRNVFATQDVIIKRATLREAFLLRHEHDMLRLLVKYNIAPAPRNFFLEGEFAYLLMERIPGRDLGDRRYVPTPKQPVLQEQLDKILSVLKTEHIVHRDIRPHNLVMHGNTVKLIDFHVALHNGKEPKTENSAERQILMEAKRNLHDWIGEAVPLSEWDQRAVEKLRRVYCTKPGLRTYLRTLPRHLKTRLKRYANYK